MLANRQTKIGANGSLEEQSQISRMVGMASAIVARILILQNLNRRPHRQEKDRGATAWSMIETFGAGGMTVEIDAMTTVAISEETMLGPTGEMTAIQATAEVTDLRITGTALQEAPGAMAREIGGTAECTVTK